MTDFETAVLTAVMFIPSIIIALYIIWAPLTPFKQGLIDGLTLKFLWSKK